ncbi:MAG: outer membrane lipoprotein-sorting protein [Betaproteobacteria bacterium]
MLRLRFRSCLLLLLLVLAVSGQGLAASALTAEEILKKVDNNQFLQGVRIRSSLTIVSGGREVKKTFVSLIDGDRSFTEFTNARDKGTKYLKLGDELWMFFPDAEDVVKISGHLLRQGMMGSDFSYEDALESRKLTALYDAKLLGEEQLDGRATYVLELTVKPGREASYARRKQWITKAEFVPIKEELYAQSGKLLKVATASNLKQVDGRWFAFAGTMQNMLKKGSKTLLTIEELELGVTIPPQTFSREALRR